MGRERMVHVDVLVAHCGERRAQAVRARLGEANAKDLYVRMMMKVCNIGAFTVAAHLEWLSCMHSTSESSDNGNQLEHRTRAAGDGV